MKRTVATAAILLLSFLVLPSCHHLGSGSAESFQQRTQEALIKAKPGEVIDLPEGTFQLDRTLSLTVANVTVRGKGMDKTVLSFAGQTSGAEGLLVTSNGVTLEDFAIENTKGDALKVNGADGLTIRRIRTEWTGGPKETNGPYGIYPVQCRNVLIEDSVAIGASDAGIYVGQSSQIVVRRNRAEYNVAGIEIENSQFADVYENKVTNNTGGILVFNLPDLPVKDGKYTRVFKNEVTGNNTPNFAPKGNIVATVPKGTGVLVMAVEQVEIFDNGIRDHGTSNVSIVSYLVTGNPIKDPQYDPFPRAVYVHDNRISGGGGVPSGPTAERLAAAIGKLPDILYDGIADPRVLKASGKPAAASRICIQNNGEATFLNMDAGNNHKRMSPDPRPFACAHPPLTEVTLQVRPVAASGGR